MNQKRILYLLSICLSVFSGCSMHIMKDFLAMGPDSEIDYTSMSIEDALTKKYELMLPYCRHNVEREILKVAYKTLLWGKKQGLWKEVNLEDLMAHAMQESKGVLDLLAEGKDISPFGSTGTNVWNFRQKPSQDLCGFISWSVWQAITPNYLELGKEYSPRIAKLYEEYITRYGATGWNFTQKMEQVDGKEKAKEKFNTLVHSLDEIVDSEQDIHVKVIAQLITTNYQSYGVRSPNAIREYFWLAIQKNLKPENWLAPVRFNDDIPPSESNNWLDNNAFKRGDYGKQVTLGNSYNDRGIVFWYAVTRDVKTFQQIVEVWSSDPARLKKEDYILLHEKGFLKYVQDHPKIYEYILSLLP